MNVKPRILARGQVGRPRISADGSTVIWNQMTKGKWELMRYQDGQVENLSRSPDTHDLDGDISADGSVVAWRRVYEDGTEVIKSDKGREELVDGFGAEVSRISVSDDGSTVVYDENTQGQMAWNIRRYRNQEIEQVTDSKKMDAFPFVSADGERVIYTHYDEKNRLMLKDGAAEPKEIVHREAGVVQPDLSADGKTVVWTERGEDKEWRIFSRDLDSGKYTEEIDRAGVTEKQPQLASETGEILYTGYDFRDGRPAKTNIWLDHDGVQIPLSNSDKGRNTFPDFAENGEAAVWVWTDKENRNNQQILLWERSVAQ